VFMVRFSLEMRRLARYEDGRQGAMVIAARRREAFSRPRVPSSDASGTGV